MGNSLPSDVLKVTFVSVKNVDCSCMSLQFYLSTAAHPSWDISDVGAGLPYGFITIICHNNSTPRAWLKISVFHPVVDTDTCPSW